MPDFDQEAEATSEEILARTRRLRENPTRETAQDLWGLFELFDSQLDTALARAKKWRERAFHEFSLISGRIPEVRGPLYPTPPRVVPGAGLGMSRRWDQGYVPGKGGKAERAMDALPPRRKASVDTRYFVAIGMGSPSEKARVAADRMAFPQEYGRTPPGPPRPSYNDDRLDKILVQGMNTGASRARVLHDMLADVVPLSRETNISVPDIRDYLRRRGVV